MIFLTVGSALPFDRLVKLVDEAIAERLVTERVFAQIGSGRYIPSNCEYVRILPRTQFSARFDSASAVISHAGIGTIGTALKARKPLLVMPRSGALGELVDEHQLMTAKRFAALGHVLMFEDRDGLIANFNKLPQFVPVARSPNVEGVAVSIGRFLSALAPDARQLRSSARTP
jgi:UDP-N-acetylglucosamine transferase subunit ALG13